MRKQLIAGNWKMNKANDEAVDLAKNLVQYVQDIEGVDIVICPPFTALAPVGEIVKDSMIGLGAQNMFYEDAGAYTGEVSGSFLLSCGCEYVIIGHSERRKYFNEGDLDTNKKIKKAVEFGLAPILCVGETLEERESGFTEKVVRREITGAMENQNGKEKIVFAYEPIWAIGTGKTAQPEEANQIHKLIRSILVGDFGMNGDEIRILYGGSVKPENAEMLMRQSDIDGSLVGGASLDAESFSEIIRTASSNF